MRKGEESKQRLIACAAELFWKKGYSATGISEILQLTGLPKGSFYFYFKSKDELAVEVTEYYQKMILEHLQEAAKERNWEEFIEKAFAYLCGRTQGGTVSGCPYAVMGMETALSKPEVAAVFMEGLKKLQTLFYDVLLFSGVPQNHALILSERFLSVYQGELLLGRISGEASYLAHARNNMMDMYREYRTCHGI